MSLSSLCTNNVTGDLQSVDGYMNIALERCKEVSDGKVTRNWGDAFVRGNNGALFLTLVLPFYFANLGYSHIYLRRQRMSILGVNLESPSSHLSVPVCTLVSWMSYHVRSYQCQSELDQVSLYQRLQLKPVLHCLHAHLAVCSCNRTSHLRD
jgi:hypothetical protein